MTAKEAALAVWGAFGSRDAQRIRTVLTEDVRWLAPRGNATQIALGLPPDLLETREGIVDFLTQHFRRLFPTGAQFEFTSVIADGNTVVFEQRMRATAINGRTYDNRYCWIFEMQGERVREIREYMDTLAGQRLLFGDATPRTLVPDLATP